MKKILTILLLSSLSFVACNSGTTSAPIPSTPKPWLITQQVTISFGYADETTTTPTTSYTNTTIVAYNSKKQIETIKKINSDQSELTTKFTYTDKTIEEESINNTNYFTKTLWNLDADGKVISKQTYRKTTATDQYTPGTLVNYNYNTDGYISQVTKGSYVEDEYSYKDGNIISKYYAFEYGDAIPENLWYIQSNGFGYYLNFNFGKKPKNLITKEKDNNGNILMNYEYTKDTNGNITKIITKNPAGRTLSVREYTYTQL